MKRKLPLYNKTAQGFFGAMAQNSLRQIMIKVLSLLLGFVETRMLLIAMFVTDLRAVGMLSSQICLTHVVIK